MSRDKRVRTPDADIPQADTDLVGRQATEIAHRQELAIGRTQALERLTEVEPTR